MTKRTKGHPPRFTLEQRREISRRFLAKEVTYKQLQEEFGVGLATLHRAIHKTPAAPLTEEKGHDH